MTTVCKKTVVVFMEGSYTEFLYAIGAIVLGAIFIYFYLRGIGVI